MWIVYYPDWQTANHYASSLAKLIRDSLVGDEVLERDKERLKHAVQVGPRCRKGTK